MSSHASFVFLPSHWLPMCMQPGIVQSSEWIEKRKKRKRRGRRRWRRRDFCHYQLNRSFVVKFSGSWDPRWAGPVSETAVFGHFLFLSAFWTRGAKTRRWAKLFVWCNQWGLSWKQCGLQWLINWVAWLLVWQFESWRSWRNLAAALCAGRLNVAVVTRCMLTCAVVSLLWLALVYLLLIFSLLIFWHFREFPSSRC